MSNIKLEIVNDLGKYQVYTAEIPQEIKIKKILSAIARVTMNNPDEKIDDPNAVFDESNTHPDTNYETIVATNMLLDPVPAFSRLEKPDVLLSYHWKTREQAEQGHKEVLERWSNNAPERPVIGQEGTAIVNNQFAVYFKSIHESL